ncbi:MAG: S8 family serine peptidase [Acidobacteria bacterium]|nr:S8 family serine peptidase [Acidobacteriota bacterium]
MNMQRTQSSPIPSLLVCIIFILSLQGCGDTGSDKSHTTDIAPEAIFTASTYIGSYPLSVSFDASTSTDSDGKIKQFDWQFGDGKTGEGSIVQHTYLTTGTYSAQLTVTDDDGNTDTYSREIEVKPRYSLRGTVTSAEYVETDSDVNDFNASYTSNDSFNEAQEVSAPSSISGYVNLSYCGAYGRSYFSGDPEDYYLVSLNQGTNITLYMSADTSSSELNLYLYDEQQNLKDATQTDESGFASLNVQESDNYFLRIEAADYAFLTTASIYSLNMGKSEMTTRRNSPRLSENFVAGEVLVRFEEPANAAYSGTGNGLNFLSSMGLYTSAKASARDKLWRLSKTIDKKIVFERLGIQSAIANSLAPGKSDPETASKLETLWMVRTLRREAGIRLAEPNYIRRSLTLEPNDSYYSYQWHYPLIGLPEAWEFTTGSSDVVVAVVDSGILGQHPDLAGQIADGYDFVSNPDNSLDGDGVDADPEDPGDGGINGSSFHGTHTAGTIAARSNNNNGVAGVAWNAKIMPLRVLGYGGMGTTSDIIEAVKYAAGMETEAGVRLNNPVDIINLSLGGKGYSQIEEEVYREVRSQGVLIVASAGNDGTSEIMYPAGYDGVVSVSAVNINGEITYYSSFGTTIDVAAPGGSSTDTNGDGYMDGVLSTVGDDSSGTVQMGYAFYAGTSMAAPHVAGVAALMKALYPGMTPDNFDTLLAAGYLTESTSETGWDNKFGYGLINAYKAVLIAKEAEISGGIPAILSVAPRVLNFGTLISSLNVTVFNGGDGSLNVDNFYSNATWLSVTPSTDVDGNGFGTYIVDVKREGLDDGIYTATLTFEAGTQLVRISVSMQIGLNSRTASGGYHYILLLDAETKATLAQYPSPGTSGLYEFGFTGLSYGTPYVVFAGTDPDNNGYICGEGETCGAYISLDQPIKLEIQENTQGIDFTTDIIFDIPDDLSEQIYETGSIFRGDASSKILK